MDWSEGAFYRSMILKIIVLARPLGRRLISGGEPAMDWMAQDDGSMC